MIDTLKDFFLNYNKFIIEYDSQNKTLSSNTNLVEQYRYEIKKLEEKEKRALDLVLEGLLSKEKLREIQKESKLQRERFEDMIQAEYMSVYNEFKQGILHNEGKSFISSLYEYAEVYFEEASYEELQKVVDIMIEKVIVPRDKSKSVRIILNAYP